MDVLKGYTSADAAKVTASLDKDPPLICIFGHAYNSLPGIYVLMDLSSTNMKGTRLPVMINPSPDVPFCKHFNYFIPFKDIARNILDDVFDGNFVAYPYPVEGWTNEHPYSSVPALKSWISRIPIDMRIGYSTSEMMRIPPLIKDINAASANNLAVQQRLYWIKKGMAEGISASQDLPVV